MLVVLFEANLLVLLTILKTKPTELVVMASSGSENNVEASEELAMLADKKLPEWTNKLFEGIYGEAEDNVKKLWTFLSTKLYLRVYKRYSDPVRKGRVGDVTKVHALLDATDEAIVMLILSVKMPQLLQLVKSEVAKERGSPVSMNGGGDQNDDEEGQEDENGSRSGGGGGDENGSTSGGGDEDGSRSGGGGGDEDGSRSGGRNERTPVNGSKSTTKGRKQKTSNDGKKTSFELTDYENKFRDIVERIRSARENEGTMGWYTAMLADVSNKVREQNGVGSRANMSEVTDENPPLLGGDQAEKEVVYESSWDPTALFTIDV